MREIRGWRRAGWKELAIEPVTQVFCNVANVNAKQEFYGSFPKYIFASGGRRVTYSVMDFKGSKLRLRIFNLVAIIST